MLVHPRRAAIAGSGVILLGASLVPWIRIADDARALVAGVGIDYGVLMADADRDPDEGAPRERAFSRSVAAVTTLADFGSFALADYYALATIGQAVLLAVFSSAVYALFLPQSLAVLFKPKASAAVGCGDRGPAPT